MRESCVDPDEWWRAQGARRGIAPEVLTFIQMRPELLHPSDPASKETMCPSPQGWVRASLIVQRTGKPDRRDHLDAAERTLLHRALGEAAATEFSAFLDIWRELPHPQTVLSNPESAPSPAGTSAQAARLALPSGERHQHRRDRDICQEAAPRGRSVPRGLLRPARPHRIIDRLSGDGTHLGPAYRPCRGRILRATASFSSDIPWVRSSSRILERRQRTLRRAWIRHPAGWPRVVAHPRLPQIRACPIRAPGSSNDGLAAQRYTLCTTRAGGRG